MTQKVIRVLVVDDSAVIREVISDELKESPQFEVVGTARDGKEALERFEKLQPDVVTLDVQMPRMDGLETLDAMLAIRPVPVIMVSGLTQVGADITLQALDRGALDYVAKPTSSLGDAASLGVELRRKIRTMAGTDVRRLLKIRKERAARQRRQPRASISAPRGDADTAEGMDDRCVAIGISTGGPPALSGIFESLEGPLPPIIVVQHMPAEFTGSFAWRLNSISALSVKEAASGDPILPNHVLIAPGGKHLSIRKGPQGIRALVRAGDAVSGHKPSVDVMMKSVAELFGESTLGVIMTGMGRDGVEGCRLIREAGGYVLGQDQESSDVYGMNRQAMVEGHVDQQFSLDDAAQTITKFARKIPKRQPAGTS